MNKKKLDLSEFNVENENILDSSPNKKKQIHILKKRAKKKENLIEKIQISLTQEEYDKLYSLFEKSGFPSFSGYLRMKLKEIKFI